MEVQQQLASWIHILTTNFSKTHPNMTLPSKGKAQDLVPLSDVLTPNI